MNLRVNESDRKEIAKINCVFVDNDYLAMMYDSPEILAETVRIFSGKLTVDPFTRFEFLRDVFYPKIRATKELFLESKVFWMMPDHPELYNAVRQHAIKLSYIYASQGKGKGASFPDLILAGQLVRTGEYATILTGNRKDYPSIIFDVVSILGIDKPESDEVKSVTLLKLNRGNLKKHEANLAKMDSQTLEEVRTDLERLKKK